VLGEEDILALLTFFVKHVRGETAKNEEEKYGRAGSVFRVRT
jgi:hypothetical protein